MALVFNEIKTGFVDYLVKKGEIEQTTNAQDISVFDYAEEFREYLEGEYSQDELSDFSEMLSQITNLEFSEDDDKFVYDEEDTDDNGTFILDLINELLENDDFKAMFIDDGENASNNKTVSADDIEKLFQSFMDIDENGEDLSIKDITEGLLKIKQDPDFLNTKDTTITSKDKETVDEALNIVSDTTPKMTNALSAGTPSYSSTPVSTAGGRRLNTNTSNNKSDNQTVDLKSKSVDWLTQELETAKGTLQEKQDNLNSVQNESIEVLANAKEKVEEYYQTYEDAIAQAQDENEQYDEKLKEAKEKVDTRKQALDEQDTQITEAKNNLKVCENNITSLEGSLAQLKARLTELNNQNKEGDLSSMIASLNSQISAVENQLGAAKKEKETLEGKINTLEDEREMLEQDLLAAENALKELQEEIDERFKDNEEVMEAKANWEEAKQIYTDGKQQLLTGAQAELTQAQNYLNEVQTALNEAQTRKTLGEHSVFDVTNAAVSDNGINLIKQFEGCSLKAYWDSNGYSIGYGHHSGVSAGQTITQAQADEFLRQDLARFEGAVKSLNLPFELNQNQFDALVSFAYNCGENNLQSLVNNRSPEEIAKAMLQYNHSNGAVLEGLTDRRQTESKLFLTGV